MRLIKDDDKDHIKTAAQCFAEIGFSFLRADDDPKNAFAHCRRMDVFAKCGLEILERVMKHIGELESENPNGLGGK